MSDEKLAELERRFRETGAVEDEAALLSERVRVGDDLDRDDLELAAYVGSEAARALLDETWIDQMIEVKSAVRGRVEKPSPAEDMGIWVLGLDHWDPELSVRVAVAIGGFLYPIVVEHDHPGTNTRSGLVDELQAGLHAAEDWLVDQTDAALAHVKALLSGAPETLTPWQSLLATVPLTVVQLLEPASPPGYMGTGAFITERTHRLQANSIAIDHPELPDGQEDNLAAEKLRDVIRADLVPFILGYGDPVRERVEARRSKQS